MLEDAFQYNYDTEEYKITAPGWKYIGRPKKEWLGDQDDVKNYIQDGIKMSLGYEKEELKIGLDLNYEPGFGLPWTLKS